MQSCKRLQVKKEQETPSYLVPPLENMSNMSLLDEAGLIVTKT